MLVWIICEDDEINKYKYICYSECTKGTYTSIINKYLCEKNINNYIQYLLLQKVCLAQKFIILKIFLNKKMSLNTHNEKYYYWKYNKWNRY